jgi:hypothetical protein
MAFGRRAIQSNVIALFMLQQRRQANSFDFALRHAATCGARAPVYFSGKIGRALRKRRVCALCGVPDPQTTVSPGGPCVSFEPFLYGQSFRRLDCERAAQNASGCEL